MQPMLKRTVENSVGKLLKIPRFGGFLWLLVSGSNQV